MQQTFINNFKYFSDLNLDNSCASIGEPVLYNEQITRRTYADVVITPLLENRIKSLIPDAIIKAQILVFQNIVDFNCGLNAHIDMGAQCVSFNYVIENGSKHNTVTTHTYRLTHQFMNEHPEETQTVSNRKSLRVPFDGVEETGRFITHAGNWCIIDIGKLHSVSGIEPNHSRKLFTVKVINKTLEECYDRLIQVS